MELRNINEEEVAMYECNKKYYTNVPNFTLILSNNKDLEKYNELMNTDIVLNVEYPVYISFNYEDKKFEKIIYFMTGKNVKKQSY